MNNEDNRFLDEHCHFCCGSGKYHKLIEVEEGLMYICTYCVPDLLNKIDNGLHDYNIYKHTIITNE